MRHDAASEAICSAGGGPHAVGGGWRSILQLTSRAAGPRASHTTLPAPRRISSASLGEREARRALPPGSRRRLCEHRFGLEPTPCEEPQSRDDAVQAKELAVTSSNDHLPEAICSAGGGPHAVGGGWRSILQLTSRAAGPRACRPTLPAPRRKSSALSRRARSATRAPPARDDAHASTASVLRGRHARNPSLETTPCKPRSSLSPRATTTFQKPSAAPEGGPTQWGEDGAPSSN